ncbi:MAG TPA: hypothetical protein VD735_01840 [Candidatus Saccharimonadales bacterium]|nr:hypothetical protein [Candidatus Saccharimonadales bacterium]
MRGTIPIETLGEGGDDIPDPRIVRLETVFMGDRFARIGSLPISAVVENIRDALPLSSGGFYPTPYVPN